MIRVPVSPERARALLRRVVPQLSIAQRLKLMRELVEAGSPEPSGGSRAEKRETAPARREPAAKAEKAPPPPPEPEPAPAPEPALEPLEPAPAAHWAEGAVPPADPVVPDLAPPVAQTAPAVEAPPAEREPAPPPVEVAPPPVQAPITRVDAPTPLESPVTRSELHVVEPTLEDAAQDAAFSHEAQPVPTAGRLDISQDWPAAAEAPAADAAADAGDGEDGEKPRATWERRLYKLFKPARAQARQLDGTALSMLIRQAVTEVRSK